jgi:hypothetical protein
MKNAAVITLVLTAIAWVFLWPLAAIWALNTLFAMGIAYTFWNWLAMIVLTAFFGKASLKVNKD